MKLINKINYPTSTPPVSWGGFVLHATELAFEIRFCNTSVVLPTNTNGIIWS